jgi:endo-1,4-beta-mannosidase
MTLSPVSLVGTYFEKNKKPFIPVGAHWVPAKAALQWPYQWDAADIEADFSKMKDLGFNTVRFDLFWAWFEPRPGDYNPLAFEQLDFFVKLAHQYDIYLHPTFFIGGEVGEAFWDVPWRHGRHPHADPEMLRLQTDHAAEIAGRYKDEPAILAWDLTDEPPYWIAGARTTDAMAINWTRLIAGAVRRVDLAHLLCVGTSMEDVSHGPFRPDNIAGEVNFFSAHPYSIYSPHLFPDPMLSERGTYCGAFQTALSSGAGHPVMIHEQGASSAQYKPERIAALDRVTMYSSLAAGANGFLLWCYTDAAPQTFNRVPYLRAPHETQFGLTTWDRQDRPAGKELRSFSRVLSQLDLEGITPARGDAALLVPFEWTKPLGDFSRFGLSGPEVVPYVSTQDGTALPEQPPHGDWEANSWLMGAFLSTFVLARRAGLKVDLVREYADWSQYPMLLIPSPLTSTHVNLVHLHTNFWDRVCHYVQEGGTVYASLCADTAIPEMVDLFGAMLVDHDTTGEVQLTVKESFTSNSSLVLGPYQPSLSGYKHWPAVLEIHAGQVAASDQNGHPAIVTNRYGKGKTVLCAYPLESYLAFKPSAFEGIENTHKLYEAITQWADIQPFFRTNNPSVEVAALSGNGRGYAVLANHRGETCQVRIIGRQALKSAIEIKDQGKFPLNVQGTGWEMQIQGYGGAVVEWKI